MNDRQRKALELMTADLKPNEKIFVFGPGGARESHLVLALTKLLGFCVFALVTGIAVSAASIPPEMRVILAISIILIAPCVLWVANDKQNEASFYALTNHRLLLVDYEAIVKTVTKRSAIRKMHSTEHKISLDFGEEVLLITKLNLTEPT